MSEKSLRIKRIFAYLIYNSLKNTPPKDYPTTGEIKSTISDILPALKPHIEEYLIKLKDVVDLSNKVAVKELTEADARVKVDEINNGWRVYTKEHGNDIVDINIGEEGIKTLKTQFSREGWGKNWVVNIEEFAELLDVFEEAAK